MRPNTVLATISPLPLMPGRLPKFAHAFSLLKPESTKLMSRCFGMRAIKLNRRRT